MLDISELLDALARTPGQLALSIVGLSEAEMRHKKADDEFSIVENVCHLRDLEVEGYAVRINRILSEEQPVLPDFNGGQVAAERNYHDQDVRLALEAFGGARKQNLNRLRLLKPDEFECTAILEGVGRITLKDLLSMMRKHDEGHLQTLV